MGTAMRRRALWMGRAAIAMMLAVPAAGPAAAEDAAVEKVGDKIDIKFDQLPPLGGTPSAPNPPKLVPRPEGATLSVPPGFEASLFAEDMDRPRYVAVAPDGDVFVAESSSGTIVVLKDPDKTGKAQSRYVYAQGLSKPHGITFHQGKIYIADIRAVWVADYKRDQPGSLVPVTPPGALGSSGNHWTRNVLFRPDGAEMVVAIGSLGNIAEEPEPYAAIKRFDANGGNGAILASGLRNPVGIAYYPGTQDLYTVVNERDTHGDEMVPDYLTRVEPGAFYGWPYAYLGPHEEPKLQGKRPDLVAKTKAPDLLFRAHSAPIGLVFYTGNQFPADYKGDAFVTLRGSWNANVPRGYTIVRVPFKDGRPAGGYEVFATGFRTGGTGRADVWGRPAGIAQAADGALLIADDSGKAIWRIAYTGKGR